MHLFLITYLLLQPAPLYVVSPDFTNGGNIPVKCTCDGENTRPVLIVNGIPQGTKSLAVIAESLDAAPNPASGWLAWNLPPIETMMEGVLPGYDGGGTSMAEYRGPCPTGASQKYSFKVFALDTVLTLNKNSSDKASLMQSMEGKILAKGELTGIYSRSQATKEKKK